MLSAAYARVAVSPPLVGSAETSTEDASAFTDSAVDADAGEVLARTALGDGFESVAPSTTMPGRVVGACASAGAAAKPKAIASADPKRSALCRRSVDLKSIKVFSRMSTAGAPPRMHLTLRRCVHLAHTIQSPSRTNCRTDAPDCRCPSRDCSLPFHSRHDGCPLLRAPRTEDGRLVPAGLLARGSSASGPAFPTTPGAPSVAQDGRRLATYSCGGSRGIGRMDHVIQTDRHRVPFSPTIQLDCEDRHTAIKLDIHRKVNSGR